MEDILDNIEIGTDSAGLLLKATVGIFMWNRRERFCTIYVDVDTYQNLNDVYGDKIESTKYKRFELSFTTDKDQYEYFNTLGNDNILIKQLIKFQVLQAAGNNRFK